MKAFSALTNKLGIDLGSSQVRIFRDDRVVLEESSVAVVAEFWDLAQTH